METFFSQKEQGIRLGEKIVIVINGKGGAGKDTVCEIASRYYRVKMISAITPIKEIASNYGWNGEKDNKARKFLSDLKRVFIEYNDLPNRYLVDEYTSFAKCDSKDVLFVHIRENDQIDAFKNKVGSKCVTMLVRSSIVDNANGLFGNYSDDYVDDYKYDYEYINSEPMEVLVPDFMDFLYSLFLKEGVASSANTGELPWQGGAHG